MLVYYYSMLFAPYKRCFVDSYITSFSEIIAYIIQKLQDSCITCIALDKQFLIRCAFNCNRLTHSRCCGFIAFMNVLFECTDSDCYIFFFRVTGGFASLAFVRYLKIL